MASDLGHNLARELARWRPPQGVVSAYVHIDPGDRGGGWRIGLRDALAGADEDAARRVLRRFEDDAPPSGRTQIGFVEVDGDRREIWHGVQLELGRTEVVQASRPHLAPLMRILDQGWPVGVVVLALERIRVLEWRLAEISELAGWELELTDLDWRERKAPQRNPQAGGTGAGAAGRDQHAQRLEQNRESFLKHAGHLLVARYGERPWRRVIVIGANDRPKLFVAGMGGRAELAHEVPHDLIGAGATAIGERVGEEVEHLNRSREEELIARLESAVNAKRGAAFGPEKVDEALEQARVRHLIFDATRDWARHDGVALVDPMIERALDTDAEVTPVDGLAASSLSSHGGVAALLRY
ncbi:MAG: hypothetical protein GEU88_00445 [Solirubrobacterales bacterium]|nr:hypothetical protein [Solirubrobacterales bacterium]